LTRPPPEKLDRSILIVASVVIVGAIMSILDTTIVNVALATLSRELHAPLSTIQWVSTGYLVALATVIPLTGWAAERFGSKRLWLSVVALFTLGSALSGLAWSAESLIVFRVLQGLGGGMIMPAGMTILAQKAGPQRMGRVMSVVGAPMLLGPIMGPVLGGLILEGLSWRWIFYVNLPLGLLALTLGMRLLPRDEPGSGERLDLRGLLLLSPGLALVVFGLSESSTHGGFGAPVVWGPVVAGIAFVAAFVRHALRVRDRRPLLDLTLFRKAGFAAAAATVFLVGAALFGALLLLPLYFQEVRGESTLATGLFLAPQGLGAACCMPISGRLTDRIGGGPVVLFGLTVMTIATIALTFIGASTPFAAIEAILFVRGIGLGATLMPAQASALSTVTRGEVPHATTVMNVLQRVGGSLGTALLAVILDSRLRHAGPGASPAARAHAFSHTFWFAAALTAAGLVPAFVLALRVRGRRREAPAGPSAPVQA
jgi:EmrB/QacA subfamily drug resistance transporter